MGRPPRAAAMLLAVLLLPALATSSSTDPKAKQKKEERATARLPPCAACSSLAQSFEKGLERTSRGKFEGGDTAWEEKNQVSGYANSEVRFVEVQEELCKDVERGEQQCHHNHQEWEDDLEEWWALADDRGPLRQWLCVDRLEVCCPEGTFGKDCRECSVKDEKGRMCSGNGKCKGDGTRKGSGKCACSDGYTGDLCDKCDIGYYDPKEDSGDVDEGELKCTACHRSCQTHCTGSGPKGCIDCKSGYLMDTEKGCTDLDECVVNKKPCKKSQFCQNTQGSYRCGKCSEACDGCSGAGAGDCAACATGYTWGGKEGKTCITDGEAGRIRGLTSTRLFTYAGLCIVTCIVFQRSAKLAGALGAVSAVYMGVAEYYLSHSPGGELGLA